MKYTKLVFVGNFFSVVSKSKEVRRTLIYRMAGHFSTEQYLKCDK